MRFVKCSFSLWTQTISKYALWTAIAIFGEQDCNILFPVFGGEMATAKIQTVKVHRTRIAFGGQICYTWTISLFVMSPKQLIKNLSKQVAPWEIDGGSLLGQQTPHEYLPCLLFHIIALPLEGNLRHMRRKKFLVQYFFA